MSAMTRQLLTCAMLFIAGAAWADINVWASHGPDRPVEADVLVTDVLRTTVLAATDGGVFKSTDGGSSWHAINAGLPNARVSALAIDPVAPATFYAGTSSGVFKSTDGGGVWTGANSGLVGTRGVYALAVVPVSAPGCSWSCGPSTVYAGAQGDSATRGGGIFKSEDGGNSWRPVNVGLLFTSVSTLVVDPNSETLYAIAFGRIFKSTNGGEKWSPFGPSGTIFNDFAIDPTTTPSTLYVAEDRNPPGRLMKSTDDGASWSATTQPGGYFVSGLDADPYRPGPLYAITAGGIFKTTGGGSTWIAINTSLPNPFSLLSLISAAPDTIYARTAPNGVFKSTDGGANWSDASSGLTGPTNVWALAVDPTAPDRLYAGTTGAVYAGSYLPGPGVFKSTDRGASWDAVNTGLTSTNVRALAVDPTVPGTVYAGTDDGVFYGGTDGGVFKSTDAGRSWGATGVLGGFNALAVDPMTPTTLYAGCYSGCALVPWNRWGRPPLYGLLKSTDSGGTWVGVTSTSYETLPDWGGVAQLAIDPTTPDTLYVGRTGGVFKTTDGAGTWSWSSVTDGSTRVLDIIALAIDPTKPSTLYAGTVATVCDGDCFNCCSSGRGGVFKSTDGGSTWNDSGLHDTTRVAALVIDPITSETVYAGTPEGTFESTDGGDTWAPFNAGLTSRDVRSLALDPTAPTRLYAGTQGGGVFAT